MSRNTRERTVYTSATAVSSDPFKLKGGSYGVSVNATFGGGSVTLQRLSADGSTWVTVMTAFTAAGYATALLINGTYRFTVATSTVIVAEIVSICTPLE